MAGGGVREGGLGLYLSCSADRADQVHQVDVDANGIHLLFSQLSFKLLLGVPDLEY